MKHSGWGKKPKFNLNDARNRLGLSQWHKTRIYNIFKDICNHYIMLKIKAKSAFIIQLNDCELSSLIGWDSTYIL